MLSKVRRPFQRSGEVSRLVMSDSGGMSGQSPRRNGPLFSWEPRNVPLHRSVQIQLAGFHQASDAGCRYNLRNTPQPESGQWRYCYVLLNIGQTKSLGPENRSVPPNGDREARNLFNFLPILQRWSGLWRWDRQSGWRPGAEDNAPLAQPPTQWWLSRTEWQRLRVLFRPCRHPVQAIPSTRARLMSAGSPQPLCDRSGEPC